MKKNNFLKNKQGFTLIEILVTMTIVAILMGISLVSLLGARKVARDGKRKADLEQIRSALEIYRSDCKTYPALLISPLEGCPGDLTPETYLEVVPVDPLDAAGYSYSYIFKTENSYTLCAHLETGSTEVDSGCDAVGADCGFVCNYKTSNY